MNWRRRQIRGGEEERESKMRWRSWTSERVRQRRTENKWKESRKRRRKRRRIESRNGRRVGRKKRRNGRKKCSRGLVLVRQRG